MDRGELASFLYTAERISPMHAALAVLLGLNGLRVSEACGANVENLGFERGHRTLQIVGKGNKPAGVPLVPRTARTLDLAIGERTHGPILIRHDGRRLDARTAYRWVRSVGNRAGLERTHPHMLRAAFIMAALDAGVPLRDVQIAARHADPRTTTIYDRRDRTTTDTPPTQSSPSSPAADHRPRELRSGRPVRPPDTQRRYRAETPSEFAGLRALLGIPSLGPACPFVKRWVCDEHLCGDGRFEHVDSDGTGGALPGSTSSVLSVPPPSAAAPV